MPDEYLEPTPSSPLAVDFGCEREAQKGSDEYDQPEYATEIGAVALVCFSATDGEEIASLKNRSDHHAEQDYPYTEEFQADRKPLQKQSDQACEAAGFMADIHLDFFSRQRINEAFWLISGFRSGAAGKQGDCGKNGRKAERDHRRINIAESTCATTESEGRDSGPHLLSTCLCRDDVFGFRVGQDVGQIEHDLRRSSGHQCRWRGFCEMRLVETVLYCHRRYQGQTNRQSDLGVVAMEWTVNQRRDGDDKEEKQFDDQHRPDRRVIQALKFQADEPGCEDDQAKNRECQ